MSVTPLPFNAPNTNEEIEVDLFDDGAYTLKLYMYNEDGKIVKLRKGAIEQLDIVDDLLKPFHSGELTYTNTSDAIERSSYHMVGDNKQNHNTWRFRGDCRDFIRFEMHPVLDDDITMVSVVDGAAFSLIFDFVIYKIEDIPSESTTEKQKKVFFRDIRMQRMLERDLFWNSGEAAIRQQEVTHSRPLSQLTNDERYINRGRH